MRRGAFLVLGVFLLLVLLPAVFPAASGAGEKKSASARSSSVEGGGPGKAVALEGKLTGYGKHFVALDGEKILLCKDCVILDQLENQISTDGLVATETVEVTILGDCAAEVKATLTRN